MNNGSFREALWESSGSVFPATVVSVDREKNALVVRDEEGIAYPDVRLTAVLQQAEDKPQRSALVVYPCIGSSVLVAAIGNSDCTLFCVAYSQLEALACQIADTRLQMDERGLALSRQNKHLQLSLKTLFEQLQRLCEELAKVAVKIGTTVDTTAVGEIKDEIEKAHKDLNEILKPCH